MYVFKLSANEPKNILQSILINPKIRIKDAMNIIGIKYFIDKHGIKTLKDMIKHRFTPESWYRYESQIDKIVSKTLTGNFIVEEFNQMKKQLIQFEPFKFDNLKKIV
jgi:hypothetical protein